MTNQIYSIIKSNLTKKRAIVFFISLLQLSYLYVVIRYALPKLTIVVFIAPILVYNKFLLDFIVEKLPDFSSRKDRAIYFALCFFLSIAFYKSINLVTVFVREGSMSIPYVLGGMLFFLQFVLIITSLLCRVAISRKTNIRRTYYIFIYAIPSLLITTLLYLIYFPGLCSADSLHVWTEVGNNIFSDTHPIIYMLLIKLLRILWNDIAVIALFQIILCSLTFGFITNELRNMNVPNMLCWICAVLLPLIPANAMYTITMWKDVPYTMGLLLLCMLLLRSLTSDYYSSKRAFAQIFVVSLFTLFMRHNALISVMLALFFFGVHFIVKRDKKLIFKTLILGFTLIIAFFGIKSMLFCILSSDNTNGDYTGNSLASSSKFPPTIAQQQIIYTEHIAGTSFNHLERTWFKRFFNEEGLSSHKEKYSANSIWQFYHKPLETTNLKEFNEHPDVFWKLYWRLWWRFPRSMFGGYERITSINWASSSYGSVAYRGTVTTNIEGLELYVYRPIIQKSWNYKLDKSIFAYIDSSLTLICWRPAFAFLMTMLFCIVAYRKHGPGPFFMFLPVILNQLTYFIVTASQDTRYTYVNYTLVMIMLVLSLMKPSCSIKKEEESMQTTIT